MCTGKGLGLFLVGLAIATVEGFPESSVLNVSPVLQKGGGGGRYKDGECACWEHRPVLLPRFDSMLKPSSWLGTVQPAEMACLQLTGTPACVTGWCKWANASSPGHLELVKITLGGPPTQ